MPSDAVYATRPQIRLNGQPAPALDVRLTELVIAHALNRPAHCRAIFSSDTALAVGDAGAFGDDLRIDAGDASTQIFSGNINALGADFHEDAPPTSVIVAEDRLRSLDMSQHSRVFTDVSDQAAIAAVCAEAGLVPQFEIDAAEITHDVIVQGNQTDLEFICARAQRIGADVWCEDDQLIVRAYSAWETSSALTLTYGAGLARFSVLADLTTQTSALELTGWSVAQKATIAQAADLNAAALTLNNGETGSMLLTQSLGEQTTRIVHSAPADHEEALGHAQARFETIARGFIRGSGMVPAQPELAIGKLLDLQGLGEHYDGLYHCVGVRHHFDLAQGYRVEFDVERGDFARDNPKRPPPSLRPGIGRPPIIKPRRGK